MVEGLEARDGLVLAEGAKQVRELMLGNVELLDGFGKRDEYWMARSAVVAGVEFGLPLVE